MKPTLTPTGWRNRFGVARPPMLDLYCGGGGSSMGFANAGWDVTGVDSEPQPHYPFKFHRGDAVEFAKEHGHKFEAIVGGPVCKYYSKTQRIRGNDHPAQIPDTRAVMRASGKLYVIENVEDAESELLDPMMLCGLDFGLHTYRHRLFESNVRLTRPGPHVAHPVKTVKMGRWVEPGEFYHAVGRFSGVDYIRRDMGVGWMNRDEIAQCIPPVYTEHIGTQLLRSL